MYSQLAVLFTAVAALAKPTCAKGIYHSPKGESFVTMALHTRIPINVTTPAGAVAMFAFPDGNVTGTFTGKVSPGISAATETLLAGSNGQHTQIVTTLIWENDKKDSAGVPQRVIAEMHGLTTYANNALHGFGFARLQTTIPDLLWINFATFLVEWEAVFTLGLVNFELFNVKTGGRLDGKPIPALQGSR